MTVRTQSRLQRRAFVRRAALICVGAGLARQRLRATEPRSSPLITKAIPSTGEQLPAIGLGSDSFRESARAEIQAEIGRLRELGGTVIDTAAAYGDSEALIGDALAALGIREHMFVATKLTAGGYFGGVGGDASLQRSLQRLRVARIDLLQVHNLDGIESLMPKMQQWKRSGVIRYIGVTTSRLSQHAAILTAMRDYPVDFIQVDYSIGNRDAAAEVLPMAQTRRIAVLVNLPLARAALIDRAGSRPLPEWVGEIDVTSWSQFFLKYVISHPAVTCAIPGSTKRQHLEDNQAAARGRLPDATMRRRMEEYWDRAA